jgi:hypothetical protein
MGHSAIFKLVCAVRQLTDAFNVDANIVSEKFRQAAEDGNSAAQEFRITNTWSADWDSMLSHLIFASWGQMRGHQLKLLVSPAYTAWKLKSLCFLGDDPEQECQQYHQLAQRLVANETIHASN